MDLIGPYTINTQKGKIQLRAVTMMDPATDWFKIVPVTTPDSDSCQRAFDLLLSLISTTPCEGPYKITKVAPCPNAWKLDKVLKTQ